MDYKAIINNLMKLGGYNHLTCSSDYKLPKSSIKKGRGLLKGSSSKLKENPSVIFLLLFSIYH